MRRTYRIGFVLLAALSTSAAGCGGSEQTALKGKVTLDGVPVENGSIAFYSTAEGGPRAAAAIQNGEYAVPLERGLKPGSYRVEVSWQKPTGKKIPSTDPGFLADETREVVPDKYNVKSTLTADVAAGENIKDFPLTTN